MTKCEVNGCNGFFRGGFGSFRRFTCEECYDYLMNHNGGIWDADWKIRRAEEERRRAEEERRRAEEERRRAEALGGEYKEEFESIEKVKKGILFSNQSVEDFYLGKIRIGCPHEPLWKEVYSHLMEMPNIFEEKENRMQHLQREVLQAKEELEGIEKRKKNLQDQIQKTKEVMKELEEDLQSWMSFKQENWTNSLDISKKLAQVEENLLEKVKEQIEKDPGGLTSIHDVESEKPKLSLVFNAMGISPSSISLLSDISGDEFIVSTWEHVITDIGELADIRYCADMLENGNFLSHELDCPVCCCKTPQDLQELLEEHNKSLSNNSSLEKYQINGRRFLFLPGLFYQNLSKEKAKEIRSAVVYLKKLHNKYTTH